ncbi:MAG: hypothetical protein KIG26_06605 [Lachnospiraceae bacterium]|nr:hypothetical protein [Lachnospiraceae bacterium]
MKNTSRIIFYVIGIMAIVGIAFMIIGKMNNGHLINVNIGRDGVKISDEPDFDMDTSDIGLNLIKGSEVRTNLPWTRRLGMMRQKCRN